MWHDAPADLSAVDQGIRDVVTAEFSPRFRALAYHRIKAKGPHDYVTEAGTVAERESRSRRRTPT